MSTSTVTQTQNSASETCGSDRTLEDDKDGVYRTRSTVSQVSVKSRVSVREALGYSLARMESADANTAPDQVGRQANIERELEGTQQQDVETPPEVNTQQSGKLQDQTNLLPKKQLVVVFAGLSCALFCSILDQTMVSTALPSIGRDFNATSVSSWVGTAYLLASTACQPMYGRLSDIFGRKNILLTSLSFFFMGSVISAVSKSMIMLIIGRCVAGIGGGGVLTTAMIITSDVVSLKERGTYQSISGCVVVLSNSLGPLIGGALSEKLTWRWCFYLDIPFAVLSIAIVFFVLPLKKVTGDMVTKLKKIDYLGALVMTASAVLILLSLSWGGVQYSWNSAIVLAPLICGALLLPVFILVELKFATIPLIPIHIFKNSTVAGANAGAFLTGFMFYVNLYYLPQFYQVVRGDSSLKSGTLLLPLIIVQAFISFGAGFLVSKTGNYRINLWFGFAVWAVGQGMLSTISPEISQAKMIGYQIMSGFGGGQTFQTSLVAIQAAVKRNEMAVATGTRNFLRLLGGTIGLAACAAILNNTVTSYLTARRFESSVVSAVLENPTELGSLGLSTADQYTAKLAYTQGLRYIYFFMAACCVTAFFITLFCVKSHSLNRADDAKLKAEGKAWVAEKSRSTRT